MREEDYQLINESILKQEELLQFEHFSNREAWDLGNLMVEEIRRSGIELAVCIRKLNGNIIFQYATDQTSLNNQNWMNRKFHTVLLMERSSLGVAVVSRIAKEDIATHGLSNSDYAFCGGGFPIRIKNGGVVAVVTVSNQPHVKDHAFIVNCLAKYLKVSGVPNIDADL